MIHQKANFYVYIFSILIIISYFLGFYLNEDSAGGGKPDLLNHEWGNVQLFINNNVRCTINDIKDIDILDEILGENQHVICHLKIDTPKKNRANIIIVHIKSLYKQLFNLVK